MAEQGDQHGYCRDDGDDDRQADAADLMKIRG